MVMVPLAVEAGAEKLNGSRSASVALSLPLTTPLTGSGTPTVFLPNRGAVFLGLIGTVTSVRAKAPPESVTVTATVSLVTAGPAPTRAAAWRAAAVGV